MKNRPKEISNHKELINQLNDNGLTQLVTKPTRLENTLDLMKTNNPTRVNRTEMFPGISDHEVVLCPNYEQTNQTFAPYGNMRDFLKTKTTPTYFRLRL